MEVASLFTSEKKILQLFHNSIYSYPVLKLDTKDIDTAYFIDSVTNKSELYYHSKLSDVEYEFGYNYSESDTNYIRNNFKNKPIFLLDISFRSKEIFNNLLKDFKEYVKSQNKEGFSEIDLIISDPYIGLKALKDITS